MTPERWKKIGEIYHAALELLPSQRESFLDQACAGNEELRREVESLIAAEERAGDFIASPALKDAVEILTPEEAPSLVGKKFGRYRILAPLGRGGMGDVYLARDNRLNRQVALKLLPSEFTNDLHRVRRFEKEARAVSALNHPNIITIHEIGKADGAHFIVTEYIDGQTLRRRMTNEHLSLPTILEMVTQITGALAAAHDAGVVHRDIKPDNVMVRRDGLVKVLDFGLAKLNEPRDTERTRYNTDAPTEFLTNTDPGVIMGTPRYMSPEQARGLTLDARTDIFSLGVMLYEMVAGRPPFTGETSTDIIVSLVAEEPKPLDAPAELQRIVSKALRKDRDTRYQTANDFQSDLKRLQQSIEFDGSPEAAHLSPDLRGEARTTEEGIIKTTEVGLTDTSSSAPVRSWIRHHRRGALMTLAALFLAIVAFFFYSNRRTVLTEKDTILLADFENKTGEEVFDGTLKQALAIQLEQTPFLNLFSEDRVRETLRYMDRSPDERVTREVARQICQRQGIKAMLLGSIVRLDLHYSIILEAFNSQTGETIASAIAEANGKDEVLRALGRATKQLREELGESLASIQKFDIPVEQATTSSLEAFKAWSRGVELTLSGKRNEAVPFFKHAKELDPDFAKADVSLSMFHSNQGQLDLAADYATRAYALREKVTEREKFDIASNYHSLATGDLLQAIEVIELWRQTYPRDYGPRSRLSSLYRLVGNVEKALASAQEANRLNPRAYVPYVNMGTSLVKLNRFDEARVVIDEAFALQLATMTSRRDLYQIAFLKGDGATMKQQIDWATGKPDENWVWFWLSQGASYAGQLQQAQIFNRRAVSLIEQRNPERAARFMTDAALRDAVCGACRLVKSGASRPPLSMRISLQSPTPPIASMALALAFCGEVVRAQSLADEVARRNPQSTLANLVWLPVIRAAIELQRGHADLAIKSLQTVGPYEPGADFWSPYLRGQAYLRQGKGNEAAAEFQKILDHRGWDVMSPLYPLAHLGLARSFVLAGETAQARNAYQEFLSIWKDADEDLPPFQAAKREYESLK
jgi:serine/threonine protein kinase/Tfp pilus assembly protein PilF